MWSDHGDKVESRCQRGFGSWKITHRLTFRSHQVWVLIDVQLHYVNNLNSIARAHQKGDHSSYKFDEHLSAGHRVVSAKLLLPMWE